MLYHGSILAGLTCIRANAYSHTTGQRVAYFTQDRCYALVCCRSPEENFVTMGLRGDGKQHYFERFPDQLRTLYQGKTGYLYLPDPTLRFVNTVGHTWECGADTPVAHCETVADVYAALLDEEARGELIIHRYADIDPQEQKLHANHIKAHLVEQNASMQAFYHKYFSPLWD